VVDGSGKRLEARDIRFDPAANTVSLVFDYEMERIAPTLTAYVAYGSARGLRMSQLVSEATLLRRPLRRGGFAIKPT
jgi:hypothetical protein